MSEIQDTIDERYNYAPVVKDPTDPMRGTMRGFFGLLTGERQRQVAAARQQLEMEARARMAEQMNRAYMLEANVREKQFNAEFPDLDVTIDGESYNVRKLAQADPAMAKQLIEYGVRKANRQARVEMMRAEADETASLNRILSLKNKIREEQAKQSRQFGPFTFGGPDKKAIEEAQSQIQTEQQTYGIPLGSEPEGAEPAPAQQTGAASTWLRSKLK
jgi:hypothetical protein